MDTQTRSIVVLLLITCLTLALPAPALEAAGTYRTGLTRWRAAEGGFRGWHLEGVRRMADGTLALDRLTARAGQDPYHAAGFHDRSYYNGANYVTGEAVSPVIRVSAEFSQLIPSWNATTPDGTWVEVALRARVGPYWTRWFVVAIWAATETAVERHSLGAQATPNGYVDVDTLVLHDDRDLANAFQLRLRLFATGRASSPRVRSAAVAWSIAPPDQPAPPPGDPGLWNRSLPVPACSQMVYPDGGSVWCSPTSTAMILGYWRGEQGPCEPGVRAAVDGVYDWLYDGHGNWPFNTAYAATQGFEAYVARFTGFAQVEPWIAAGVPVAITFAWGRGELAGAALPSSSGHIAVLVGFDAQGNPVVNDPAAQTDGQVQRVYPREQLERLWLQASGGAAYVIYPEGWPTP